MIEEKQEQESQKEKKTSDEEHIHDFPCPFFKFIFN